MKRTVFYARVSTDSDIQLHSLKIQREFFKNYIKQNPNYMFCGEYIDEGISGTSLKKRKSFNKMINDAMQHKFDLILVKDISRFSRNTLDTIEQTRKLKREGIDVIFINDHIDTTNSDSEVNLTLLATMAQEESRKISNRVNWGMKKEMEKGTMFIESIYGYDVVNRELIINNKEAEVIKLIYKLYLEGYGYYRIVMKLKSLGIKSPKGKDLWCYDTIRKILSNEKYIGTLVSGKTHVQDYITQKKIKVDKENQFVFENHHEAIIEKATFDRVQMILKEKKEQYEIRNTINSEKKLFGSKIYCETCGGRYVYQRDSQRMNCKNTIYHSCSNRNSILENQVKEMIKTIFNVVFINKNIVKRKVINAIKHSTSYQNAHHELTNNKKKINKLKKKQEKYLDLLLQDKIDADEYKRLEQENLYEIQKIEVNNQRLNESDQFLKYKASIQSLEKDIYKLVDEQDQLIDLLIRKYVARIIIRNRNDFDVYFNFSSFNNQEFCKEEYSLLLELKYDFSRLESKYTHNKYKNLKETRIRIYN